MHYCILVDLYQQNVCLKNEPCMARPTFIDLNPIDLNYYPFRISLDKCNASCNAVDDLSTKVCVPSKTKDANVKVFDMKIKKYEAKTLIKHISFDCKCKFNCTTCKCQCDCKKYCTCK